PHRSLLGDARRRTRACPDRRHRIRCEARARGAAQAERDAEAAEAEGRGLSALVIRRPDDWHLHLRDGAALAAVLPFTAARFARAIVMPNLDPPVTTTAAALAYR